MEGNGNGKACGYISDGYTRSGIISEVPRLYPAVRLSWRPVLVAERVKIVDEIANATSRPLGEAIAAREVARRIVKWDLVDAKGEAVPVSPEHLLRVHPALNFRIYQVVMGYEAPDEDAAQQPQQDDPELVALLNGSTGEAQAEKNSGKG